MSTTVIQERKSRDHITRARNLASNLGVRVAAGYLRNRGWSIEGALWILVRGNARSNEFNYSQILNS